MRFALIPGLPVYPSSPGLDTNFPAQRYAAQDASGIPACKKGPVELASPASTLHAWVAIQSHAFLGCMACIQSVSADQRPGQDNWRAHPVSAPHRRSHSTLIMSSRRSSAVATTEHSLQPSRSGSPEGMTDDDGRQRSGSASTVSYIQRTPQLDIAFLHAISTHRPLGPHKHFNLIPILTSLDRTVRQIGAGLRDAGNGSDEEDEEESDEEQQQSRRGRAGNQRAPSTGRKAIKKEEEDEDEAMIDVTDPAPSVEVNSEMIWQRLGELYDLEGLEELEDGTIDGDEDSPFHTVPRPSYVSLVWRKVLGERFKAQPTFGYSSALIKIPEADVPTATKQTPAKAKKGRGRAAQQQEEEDEDEEDEERIAEFELGPWDEYEELIAPRRKRSYAPDEDNGSDSEGDLSEPSDAPAARRRRSSRGGNEQSADVSRDDEDVDDEAEAKAKVEEAEDEEAGEDDEEEEDGDEDDEDDEEDEEEEDEAETEGRRSAKRKGPATSSRKAPAPTRQKRGAAKESTPSTRTSRTAANQPRRSGRR